MFSRIFNSLYSIGPANNIQNRDSVRFYSSFAIRPTNTTTTASELKELVHFTPCISSIEYPRGDQNEP